MRPHPSSPLVCVRPPGWVGTDATELAPMILGWAVTAETLGFDGIFLGDRLLSEADSAVGKGVVYGASMLEVTTTLAAIAARTTRMLLGPLVMVFPYRHPLQLAKVTATLDVLSQGRLVLGAGIGWNKAEFDALHIPMTGRGAQFEEYVPLLRQLWAGEGVTHDGPSWSFDGARVTPMPCQTGGPPIWLASFSPDSALAWTDLPDTAKRVLRRVATVGDGWVPLVYSASSKRRLSPDILARGWDYIQQEAATRSRGRDDLSFVYSDWCYALSGSDSVNRCQAALARFFHGTWEDALRTYSIGQPDELVKKFKAQTVGIDRVDAYVLTPLDEDFEQLELLARHVAPALREG